MPGPGTSEVTQALPVGSSQPCGEDRPSSHKHPDIPEEGLSDSCLFRSLLGDVLFALGLKDGGVSLDRKGIPGRGPCLSKGGETEGPCVAEE